MAKKKLEGDYAVINGVKYIMEVYSSSADPFQEPQMITAEVKLMKSEDQE